MDVALRPIDETNWTECIDLVVAPDQDGLVAPNLFSLAQSRFEPTWQPFGIYDGETMVGFLMYDAADYELIRLMVDHSFQGRGYGTAAMRLLLDHFEREYLHPIASTSYVPGNTVAEELYRKLGYEPTGEINEGEIVVRRALTRRL
jgi:diamine N-acetyltransferase